MGVTFAEARTRMKALSLGGVRCPRCFNESTGWPLARGDNCGVGPASCIRQPATVLQTRTDADLWRLMRFLGARWPRKAALPTYPATMPEWARKEADGYLDAMSDDFYQSFGRAGGA